MLVLGPNTYKPNAKFSLLSDNIIDTVVMKPISNVTAEEKVVHTEDVTAVNVGGKNYSLPLQDDVTSTYYRTISNTRYVNIIHGNDELAKARVDCVIASGKTLCTLNEPLPGMPTVNVRLQGTSSIINRAGSTYDDYPALTTLDTPAWSLSRWIEQNKSITSNNLTRDYTGATFSMNPWVRNVVPIDSEKNPTANDVITEWVPSSDAVNEVYVWWKNWTEKGSFTSGSYPSIRMYSPNGLNYDSDVKAGTTLVMQNVNLPITYSVSKVDDYNYEVAWSVPVRYSYAAASRARKLAGLGGMLDVDNYAFVDRITNIIIELSAIPFNTSTQEITYSLVGSQLSTTQPIGDHVMNIDAGEMLTLGTYSGKRIIDRFDPSTATLGAYIGAGGQLVEDAAYFMTDYMWLPVGTYFEVPFADFMPKGLLGAAYDEDKTYLKALGTSQSNDLGKWGFIPDRDYYVRFNGSKQMFLDATFYVNYYENYLWTEQLADNLLRKYRKGIYIFECDVPANWVIKNKMSVNTPVSIKLLDGSFIRRGVNICTFYLKNIIKKYNNFEFICTLKFVEASNVY